MHAAIWRQNTPILNKYYAVKAIPLCIGVLTFLDKGSTIYESSWEPENCLISIIIRQLWHTYRLHQRPSNTTRTSLGYPEQWAWSIIVPIGPNIWFERSFRTCESLIYSSCNQCELKKISCQNVLRKNIITHITRLCVKNNKKPTTIC